MTADIERHLAKEMEGKVYEHIWILYGFGAYFIHKNFYLVKDGLVYQINDQKLTSSGDGLFQLQTECHCIGKYNPKRNYKSKSYSTTPKDIKSKLKL